MKSDEQVNWLDYIIMGVVFAAVCISLYFLFQIDVAEEEKEVEVAIDSTLIRKVDSHEQRLNRIDTLHLKYINEK